jgi:hypothetical protein
LAAQAEATAGFAAFRPVGGFAAARAPKRPASRCGRAPALFNALIGDVAAAARREVELAVKPSFFPRLLYKTRARIQQIIGKLKRFKRIALRCEKTAKNHGSFIAFACAIIWIKSVHTA